MSEVLAQQGRALTPDETEELLRDRLGEHIQRAVVEYGIFTLWVAPEGWLEAAERCRDERLLAYDMFDMLCGVDAREDGFDVVAVLYSTSTGNRIALRARCEGGREEPTLPSLTPIYRGADWMERETYDMFGVTFTDHPGLEPRILTVENFEGWPLRKDFQLASRVAKPWPGVAEPVELDEDGNKIERVRTIGDAPGPYELDKAMAEQAKAVNAPPEPEAAAEVADAEADDGAAAEATTGSTPDAGGAVKADDGDDGDRVARAKAKAEERRRKQAEARKEKARARAEAKAAQDGGDAASGGDDDAGSSDDAPAADQPKDAAAESARSGDDAPGDEQSSPGDDAPGDDAPGDEAGTSDDAAGTPQDASGDPAGDDDPKAAAKAKAEARRKRQAEARAARARARAEQSEQDDTGDGQEDA